MIWRSVVGKLWLTIIGLVSVVLLILVFLLVQFLDEYYEQEQEKSLTQLSQKIASLVEQDGDLENLSERQHVLAMTEALLPAYNTRMTVLSLNDGQMEQIPLSSVADYPDVPVHDLLSPTELDQVQSGKEQTVRGSIHLPTDPDRDVDREKDVSLKDVLIVAEPIFGSGDTVIGAIVLYQDLSQLEQTKKTTKQLVFYASIIGIFLTTIFAFFLSSRITQPLIEMKGAADKMAQGDFNNMAPIITHDEIGDLAKTFNRMGTQLDESIHALSQEKEQLSSVLKSMTDGVITVDTKRQMIITNPPADRLLKVWAEADLDNIDCDAQLLPRPLEAIFDRVVETEQEYATDLLVLGRTWEVIMAPLYARAQMRGAVAVLRDVTEERRTDKLRKDFVANVSHELRTPLAMLQGYSEALVDDIAQSPADRKELAQIIHDESLRMGRLVKELLDLARMESGHVNLEPHQVIVQTLGERVVRKFQALAKERDISLSADFPEKPVEGMIDEDSMEQVLTNLIDNGIRHTPANGTVNLEIEETGDEIVFRVKDTGAGIPAQDLPFIFERFYKSDKARTRSRAGTGLGLSIAKHIVEAHRGTISVESQEGEGTVFTIRLPIEQGRII